MSRGWFQISMAELLKKCMKFCFFFKFDAFVDVIWKSFLECLITWMLNLFQIKYFAIICSLKVHPDSIIDLRDISVIWHMRGWHFVIKISDGWESPSGCPTSTMPSGSPSQMPTISLPTVDPSFLAFKVCKK